MFKRFFNKPIDPTKIDVELIAPAICDMMVETCQEIYTESRDRIPDAAEKDHLLLVHYIRLISFMATSQLLHSVMYKIIKDRELTDKYADQIKQWITEALVASTENGFDLESTYNDIMDHRDPEEKIAFKGAARSILPKMSEQYFTLDELEDIFIDTAAKIHKHLPRTIRQSIR